MTDGLMNSTATKVFVRGGGVKIVYRLLMKIIAFYFPLFYYCLITSAGVTYHGEITNRWS